MPPADDIPLAAAGANAGRFPVRVIDVNATLSSTVGGICFSKPEDWNFHVISHTWTKLVRDWSIQVGKQVHQQLQGGHMPNTTNEYNRVFERGDFRKQACYDHFAAFFRMLQDDGVRLVWFDALCINQTDEEEKCGEISNMGAFYGHSLGCYVLAHGFGKGFGLVTTDWEFPRWFSRVWTLQEFLLPQELTFIVELDRAAVTKLILVLVHKHAHFWCDCHKVKWPSVSRRELQEQAAKEEGISDHLLLWLQDALPTSASFLKETSRIEAMSHLYAMKPAILSNHNPGSNECAQCLGWMKPLDSACTAEFWSFLQLPNSNKCMQFLKHVRQVSEESCMYCVESAGYLLLIDTLHQAETYYGAAAARAARAGGDVTALCAALEITEKTRRFMDRLKFGSMRNIPSIRERWKGCRRTGRDYDRIVSEDFPDRSCLQELNQRLVTYVELVKEIAQRDCSDGHEEDRVLSVMALLGTEGVQVVRTGRLLKEQVVELCKALLRQGEQALLVGLCASSAQPYPATGLSWAPHFCSDHYYSSMPRTERNFWLPKLPKFMVKRKDMEVLNISEDGLLQLSCQSLGAHLLPFRNHLAKCVDPLQCRACRRILASAAEDGKGTCESTFYRDSDWDTPFVNQDRESVQAEIQMRVSEILNTDGNHSLWDRYWVLHIDGSGPAFAFPHLSKNLSEQYNGMEESKAAFQVHELSPLLSSSSWDVKELFLYLPKSTLLSHCLLKTLNFKTWLLLLGFLPPPPDEPVHAPYFLFLVCIGHTQHNLHKIGFLQLDVYPSSPPATPFLDHVQPQDKFTIGGWEEIPISEFCDMA